MGKKGLAVSVIVSLILSTVLGLWQSMQAQAAVNVRPRLADVGFIDAVLTNHGVDWLFYNQPIIAWALLLCVSTPIMVFIISGLFGDSL